MGNMLLCAPDFLVVSVAQSVELWIVAPAAAGSNPVAHPNHILEKMSKIQGFYCKINHVQRAPVAQLDRASDFESAGRAFESPRARQRTMGR